MNKKQMSEADIRTKFITPAIVSSGWDINEQIREEVYFTKGPVIVRGKLHSRGKAKFADYILYYKPNIPIAIVEAKDNNHSIGSGMQQALEYGDMLDLPFIYSSNGDGFLEHDRTKSVGKIETEFGLKEFPSPDQLWKRYCAHKGIDESKEEIIKQLCNDFVGALNKYFNGVDQYAVSQL